MSESERLESAGVLPGTPHEPFVISTSWDPSGCFHFYQWVYFNKHPTGDTSNHRTPYCKVAVPTPEPPEGTTVAEAGATTVAGATPATEYAEETGATTVAGATPAAEDAEETGATTVAGATPAAEDAAETGVTTVAGATPAAEDAEETG